MVVYTQDLPTILWSYIHRICLQQYGHIYIGSAYSSIVVYTQDPPTVAQLYIHRIRLQMQDPIITVIYSSSIYIGSVYSSIVVLIQDIVVYTKDQPSVVQLYLRRIRIQQYLQRIYEGCYRVQLKCFFFFHFYKLNGTSHME